MKHWRTHPGLPWLARVLAVAMLAPYLTWGASPARAQRTAPDVFVLDFNNATTVGGQLLGRVAAAQVSLQLSESPNWSVIPDSQVRRRMQELNIHPPIDRTDRERIAQGIDASAVVYGTIREARLANGQAYVQLQVLVEDVATGRLINGAIAEGRSTARMGFTGDADVLLEEALGKAAYNARAFMDRFRLPEGTVLNTTVIGPPDSQYTDALLNIGARQGVRRGMAFIVTRQREVVGELRVTSVDSDLSTARVTKLGQGIRPEDRVRAIFSFADFPTSPRRSRALTPPDAGARLVANAAAPKVSEPAGEARVARAASGGTFLQFRQDDRPVIAQPTVQPPPPVVVEEPEVEETSTEGRGPGRILNNTALRLLVGGALVLGILAIGGRGGANATRADSVDGSAWQLEIGAPGAFNKISWDRPKAVNSSQVIQYVIYRMDILGNLEIVGVLHGDTKHTFIDTEQTRNVNDVFTAPPGSDDAGSPEDLTNVPGIQPGIQYRYQVATVFRQGLSQGPPGDGTGGGTGGGTPTDENEPRISPLSQSTPWITATAPPVIVEPVSSTVPENLDAVPVTWQQTPGSDQYVIWVGKNRNFPKNSRVRFGPFRTVPVDQGGDFQVTQVIDLSRFANARNVFITVGARNSNDVNPPRPFGYIFSAPVVVHPEAPPPGEPSAATKGKGKKNRADKDGDAGRPRGRK